MTLKVTILGCGSSGGVPRPGTGWGACDPANPKNRRRRCSILVEQTGPEGRTRVLVDTSPDLREQLIDAGVKHLDAVLYTHDHADHTHGIDDIRPLVIHMRKIIPAYATAVTEAALRQRFGYIFETPEGSDYPPIMTLWPIQLPQDIRIEGAGGTLTATPFSMVHGRGYEALGFRFGNLAYASDVSVLPPEAQSSLQGLDVLVLDALRYTRHPTHFSVSEALAMIDALKPKRAVLTNLHTDLDHAKLTAELPQGVEAAFDGMELVI
ncbi:MAG: MBL fold metallo-hydrolase [Bosea sp. (in: a-proteobacteria)]